MKADKIDNLGGKRPNVEAAIAILERGLAFGEEWLNTEQASWVNHAVRHLRGEECGFDSCEFREPEDPPSMSGAERIAAERHRQLDSWTAAHDDNHIDGMLAKVAASLAVKYTDANIVEAGDDFGDPWGLLARHPDTIRRLEIAGALIAAEIDRLHREETLPREPPAAALSETQARELAERIVYELSSALGWIFGDRSRKAIEVIVSKLTEGK